MLNQPFAEAIIRQIIKNHNFKCKITFDYQNKETGTDGYDLTINLKQIQSLSKSYSIPEELTLKLAVYHELGHVRAYQNNIESHIRQFDFTIKENILDRFNQFEINKELDAWKCGNSIIPEILKKDFDLFNEYNIEMYKSEKERRFRKAAK
ncbi:hypothetical protein O9H85_08320 [Paenibacillus filicis]|uniref:IrrE N-terminal-like domain-containing protein n=1 Tax=Paenibacillus gyeongsangnamensis TaxID=3388067 RepID=A0ABT4Q6D5_9BACL|nr:hypothetical protein [Paenibacillus filicis]MCZ8512438.1 hypothetical protein [Paenibacillus filicis]